MNDDPNPSTRPPDDRRCRRLREVLDGIIAFVGILTPEGILTEANEAAVRVSGLHRDELIGKPFWDCWWWAFDAAVQDRLRDAIARAARGEHIRYDAEVRVAGDARIIIDFQLIPHRGPDGEVDFLIPSGVDITRRVRKKEALRAAHDSFRDVVTNAPFGIFAVDADFRMAMVSAGAAQTFRTIDPLIGRDFAEVQRILWPEPYASDVIAMFRQTLETGESYQAPSNPQTRRDTADVEAYDWKIRRVTLPDGRHGVVCHFYDLSERARYEAALRDSEARFRATFDSAAIGIAHVAPDGTWLRVNRKLTEILKYSEAELRQRTFQDLTHPDDIEPDLTLFARLLNGEIASYDMEKRYRDRAGNVIWADLTVSCVRDGDGAVDYCISVIEDISDKKAAERQQKLLNAELNHRVKNILAMVQSMASHTMRTAADAGAFMERFSGRLRAIAASHDSIFDNRQLQADLAHGDPQTARPLRRRRRRPSASVRSAGPCRYDNCSCPWPDPARACDKRGQVRSAVGRRRRHPHCLGAPRGGPVPHPY